ncbi:MAG: hypothetical protein ABSA52_05905 [Candidatus Binatia bacterium]|jgi:hypothetical protein
MPRGPRLDVEGGVYHVTARRDALARAALVERGIRPVELSRYLGVSRAAITAQLRAHDT